MSVEEAAPAAGEALPAAHVAGGEGTLTPLQAARSLTDWRNKQNAAETAQETAAPAQESESAKAGEDAAPVEEQAPGETQEASPAVEEQPSVDAPRSWTKDAKEAFKLLPPALQKDVAELERSRELEIRRSQNETADKLKGLTVKEQAAEQARQQYETAFQGLQEEVQRSKAGEFADIKTQDDVDRLANEDWPRFARWQAHYMKLSAIEQESKAAQERQKGELKKQWSEFVKKQVTEFVESTPGLSDDTARSKFEKSADALLKSKGFSEQKLTQAKNGELALALLDKRLLSILHDANSWREAQEAKAKVVAKPLPPVVRPGVASNRGADAEVTIQNLEKQLNNASGNKALRIAADLQAARRAAR